MAQLSLDLTVAERLLHGSCTVNFSKGRRVLCTLMAPDGQWHHATGDTISEAIIAALRSVDCEAFSSALLEMSEAPRQEVL